MRDRTGPSTLTSTQDSLARVVPVMTRAREIAAIPLPVRDRSYESVSATASQPCGFRVTTPSDSAHSAQESPLRDAAVMTRCLVCGSPRGCRLDLICCPFVAYRTPEATPSTSEATPPTKGTEQSVAP